jgi:menaquinone-dependent protoporphyrinogen oxidase
MSKLLIAYGTTEGHTAKIAQHIAAAARRLGHEVDVVQASELAPGASLDAYAGVIVGASVHEGRYQAAVVHFLERQRVALATRPSAFFSVSLAAAGRSPEDAAEIHGMIAQLAERTGWKPVLSAIFAGALKYTEYSWLKRVVMKHISGQKGGDTDTSRDFEYTDWNQVTDFAEQFCTKLAVAKAG